MSIERITVADAAEILHVSQQFIRVGLQQRVLPIGTAVKMRKEWSYHISEQLLTQYAGAGAIKRWREGITKV